MSVKSKLLVGASAIAALAAPALAIFGVGDIVYDPSNFAEAVQMLAQLEQQYVQLVQTYRTIQGQYEQMLWMAKQNPVNMFLRYRAATTAWPNNSATDTYGTTAGWTTGVNTGQNVTASYSEATEPLGRYDSALNDLPADQADRVKRSYGEVELTDGANLSSMQTIGDLRHNAAAVATAIENLESDSLSTDPALNTEIAVLNKINAAGVISIKNTQDTNRLLVALTEGQIIQAQRERDAEARAINNHIQFISRAKAAMAEQASNASAAMLAWRMP